MYYFPFPPLSSFLLTCDAGRCFTVLMHYNSVSRQISARLPFLLDALRMLSAAASVRFKSNNFAQQRSEKVDEHLAKDRLKRVE